MSLGPTSSCLFPSPCWHPLPRGQREGGVEGRGRLLPSWEKTVGTAPACLILMGRSAAASLTGHLRGFPQAFQGIYPHPTPRPPPWPQGSIRPGSISPKPLPAPVSGGGLSLLLQELLALETSILGGNQQDAHALPPPWFTLATECGHPPALSPPWQPSLGALLHSQGPRVGTVQLDQSLLNLSTAVTEHHTQKSALSHCGGWDLKSRCCPAGSCQRQRRPRF